MGVNIVKFYGTVLVDMTDATVTPETLAEGVKAYDAKGNLITGTAKIQTGPTYTNLIPTAQDLSSTSPYNGTGYKDGKYLSSSSPFEGTDSATVLTGYIPYVVPSSGLPPTIYVKGAEWQSISHCRWFGFDSAKTTIKGAQIQGSSSSGAAAITSSFTVTQLGDKYFSLTPILNGSIWAMVKLAATASDIKFFRISLVGTGANLVITLDEPIE